MLIVSDKKKYVPSYRALLEHCLEDGWAQFCHQSEFIKNKGAIKTRGNIIKTRGNIIKTRGNLNRTRDTINMITLRTSLKLGV